VSNPAHASALLLGHHPWASALVGVLFRRTGGPGGETVLLWLAAAAAVIAALSSLCYFANWLVQRRRHYSHARLFAQLCRLHGLDRSRGRLLRRLAGQYRLSQPARLFVDPRWLDGAAMAALPGRRAELIPLRERLFGQPAPEPGEAAAE
jgi:hypothetical protein